MDEANAYLEAQQASLGLQLLADLTEILELLEVPPSFQKIYGEKRRAVVQRFGYTLIYKVVNSDVYVLAIMHGRRDPKSWQDR